MVIGHAFDDKGRKILILGVSRNNVDRLVNGKPIHLSQKTHGPGIPADLDICIFFGEDEQTMTDMFVEAGAINKDTEIIVDPKLNKES